jgi:hypothetical protein
MKQSLIFTRAAILIRDQEESYCCIAIGRVIKEHYNLLPCANTPTSLTEIETAIDFLAIYYKPEHADTHDSWFSISDFGFAGGHRAMNARVAALLDCAAKAKIIEENV